MEFNPLIIIPLVLVAVISSIIGPLLVARYKIYLTNKNKSNSPLLSSIESNKLVDEQLKLIKKVLEVDRIWVSQFHNGGHFYPTGKSISKFSITFEHTEPDIPSLSEIFSNIPVSLFNDSLKELYENDEVLIPNFEKDKRLGLNKFSYSKPIKSTYMFALKSINNDFIGTLGIEYVSNAKKLNKEEIKFLRNKATVIGAIISTYLYKNI